MSFANRNKKLANKLESVRETIRQKQVNKNPKLKNNGDWLKDKPTKTNQ